MLDIDLLREELAKRSDLIGDSLQHSKAGLDIAIKTTRETTIDFEAMRSSLLKKGEDSYALPTDRTPEKPKALESYSSDQAWCQETLRGRFVASVDGSQIYPESHLGFACALVNVGSARFLYSDPVEYLGVSRPRLLVGEDLLTSGDGVRRLISKEDLDCARLQSEVDHAAEILDSAEPRQSLLLMDGPLIYSFLQPRTEAIKRRITRLLVQLMELCDQKKVYLIGYLAASRSADWINSLRYTVLCDRIPTACKECITDSGGLQNVACYSLMGVTDSSLYGSLLGKGERSSCFLVTRKILEYYRSDAKDYSEKIGAFYVKLANREVVRLEIAYYDWMTEGDIEQIHSVTLAESIVGFGYPYALTRAHEKAIITAKEREGFYDILDRFLTAQFSTELRESSKRRMKRESVF